MCLLTERDRFGTADSVDEKVVLDEKPISELGVGASHCRGPTRSGVVLAFLPGFRYGLRRRWFRSSSLSSKIFVAGFSSPVWGIESKRGEVVGRPVCAMSQQILGVRLKLHGWGFDGF